MTNVISVIVENTIEYFDNTLNIMKVYVKML